MMTLIALALTALTLISPMAVPLYATAAYRIEDSQIVAGTATYRFISLPQPLAFILLILLTALSAYIEYMAKIKPGILPKIMAIMSLFYSIPLPYVFIVDYRDVVVILSNYAKFFSIPIYTVAILVAISEKLVSPAKRARIIADLSITEEKTERGSS